MVVRIAVLGAGINGLACAVRIKEKYKDAQVVLIAREFSPDTTGDGSAGLWYPYLCGDTPAELLSKWGCESYRFLHERWLEGGLGVCLVPIFNLYETGGNWARPYWAKDVFGYHELSREQLEYYNRVFSGKYTAGHTFSTFTFWPPPFLSYLLDRFRLAGGAVLKTSVQTLEDPLLEGFDVVVNCAGLGARTLVPDDEVFPYRGQVTRVKAPWIMEVVTDEDRGMYIIPNSETIVLGGTRQRNDYNTRLNEEDTAAIHNACSNIKPSLKSVDVHSQWVGLRPGRSAVRLERAPRPPGALLIHNYGHGGCGLTLFWGCAADVVALVDAHVARGNKRTCKL